MKLDLDPSLEKVLAIAILLFLESLIGGLIALLQTTSEPTLVQIVMLVLIAGLQLVTFLMTFLRTGEIPEKESDNDEHNN